MGPVAYAPAGRLSGMPIAIHRMVYTIAGEKKESDKNRCVQQSSIHDPELHPGAERRTARSSQHGRVCRVPMRGAPSGPVGARERIYYVMLCYGVRTATGPRSEPVAGDTVRACVVSTCTALQSTGSGFPMILEYQYGQNSGLLLNRDDLI